MLAYELSTMVSLKLHVIDNIKTRMKKHLKDVASRGGTWSNFTFLSEDPEVQDAVIEWLRKEGFAVILKEDNAINVSWDRILENRNIENRLKIAISRARRRKCKSTPFIPEIMDKDEDLLAVFSRYRDLGYCISYDQETREATIRLPIIEVSHDTF